MGLCVGVDEVEEGLIILMSGSPAVQGVEAGRDYPFGLSSGVVLARSSV